MDHAGSGLRWEPAVYEHKAAMIKRSPAAVAASPELLADALIAEHETYRPDALTVGIDVYNVEAEALGAVPVSTDRTACPEIREPLWTLDGLPGLLEPPDVPAAGRFSVLLEAAARFRERVFRSGAPAESAPEIRIAASGPVSIAAKLVGAEDLLIGMLTESAAAIRLLEFTTEVCERWVTEIRRAGYNAIVFDSSAAPPLLSPALFESAVAPLYRRIMGILTDSGQRERPLVIGGDTAGIAETVCTTGANSIICDYAASATAFASAIAAVPDPVKRQLTVRCNFDPRAISNHPNPDTVRQFVERVVALRRTVPKVIIGTGIIPYNLEPSALVATRDAITAAVAELTPNATDDSALDTASQLG